MLPRLAPLVGFVAAASALGCSAAAGSDWVRGAESEQEGASAHDDAWLGSKTPQGETASSETAKPSAAWTESTDPETGETIVVRLVGDSPSETLFRNTYYDFPAEDAGAKDATIFDASCAPITKVTQAFHDKLCVQGSGRVTSGYTVSFAKRDCGCAAVCPRTGQKICFEQLDPARFPSGRGATGRAVTPLRTIAVDSKVIPLGTAVFIPEYVGLPKPDGSRHDGCFLAEDRGVRVVGKQVDIFTGDPAMTARWNELVPSNQGVHVVIGGGSACAR